MDKGIFITGTDTGVGKTYVAARVAAELRRRGVDVGVMKPAETGCARRNGKLHPSDAVRLMRASGVRDKLEEVCPYRFSKPLAPSVAADLEGKRIDPEKMLRAFRALSRKHRFMIVEGAGGIMVPLSDRYSYLNFAKDLGLPVVIVARPGLGTINHTLLTIAAVQASKLNISGVVINHAEGRKAGAAERTSPLIIEKISGIKIMGTVGFGSGDVGVISDYIQRVGHGRALTSDSFIYPY